MSIEISWDFPVPTFPGTGNCKYLQVPGLQLLTQLWIQYQSDHIPHFSLHPARHTVRPKLSADKSFCVAWYNPDFYLKPTAAQIKRI